MILMSQIGNKGSVIDLGKNPEGTGLGGAIPLFKCSEKSFYMLGICIYQRTRKIQR